MLTDCDATRTDVAGKLLRHVPRLEPVMQILEAARPSDELLRQLGDGMIGLGARILLLALEYDTLTSRGHNCNSAIRTIHMKESRYGQTLIDQFATLVGAASGKTEIREIPLRHVQPGMTIMEDVRTSLGTLLIARGFEVSPPFLERLRNLGSSILAEKIKVLVPSNATQTAQDLL